MNSRQETILNQELFEHNAMITRFRDMLCKSDISLFLEINMAKAKDPNYICNKKLLLKFTLNPFRGPHTSSIASGLAVS